MQFTKMHGIGNDYVYIDCFKEKVDSPSELAVNISDRHFGVGSDGLVLIMPSDTEDFRMSMFNSDGTEAEMCGNAIRCVGKYVYDNGLTKKDLISIETLAGTKILKLNTEDGKVKSVRVDMGEPILGCSKIPVISDKERFINGKVEVLGKTYEITCVSMGNPHAVIYIKDVKNLDVQNIGPVFESHDIFPNRINTEFVQIIDRKNLKMRVWERGAGETLACGTGACAVAVASVLNNLSDRKVTIKLLGGELNIEWKKEDNHVYMTGPAKIVFVGEYFE